MAELRIRTLIVESSPFVRALLRAALSAHRDVEVVGFAMDGHEACDKLQSLQPEVVILDVGMPGPDGVNLLERLAGQVPAAFIMVSDLSREGATATLDALEKGAFDYVIKPRKAGLVGVPRLRELLYERVVAAARARERTLSHPPSDAGSQMEWSTDNASEAVVAIGAGSGGPQSLLQILPLFPGGFPPLLVAQHMPAYFTRAFVERLQAVCQMTVHEAAQDDRVEQGSILIAPGGLHMEVGRRGQDLIIHLDDGPRVAGHRPSLDVLFNSVARHCGPQAVGVVLSGMGLDGAKGMVSLKQAGASTIALDGRASLASGMTEAAIGAEAAEQVVDLWRIPQAIVSAIQRGCAFAVAAD